MSAGRSASALLLALLSTVVLFGVFAVVINLSFLSKHSYALDYGWEIKQPAAAVQGECDRMLTTSGFPVMTRRPAPGYDASGCLDQTNTLAREMNLALCFAAAAIISVGIAGAFKNRL